MADNAERLAKLKIDLENVEVQRKAIESIGYASLSDLDKMLLHDYIERENSLKGDIKALEGLLFSVLSRFTELL